MLIENKEHEISKEFVGQWHFSPKSTNEEIKCCLWHVSLTVPFVFLLEGRFHFDFGA